MGRENLAEHCAVKHLIICTCCEVERDGSLMKGMGVSYPIPDSRTPAYDNYLTRGAWRAQPAACPACMCLPPEPLDIITLDKPGISKSFASSSSLDHQLCPSAVSCLSSLAPRSSWFVALPSSCSPVAILRAGWHCAILP